MRFHYFLIIPLIFTSLGNPLFAQYQVSGEILDAFSLKPIANVQISIEGGTTISSSSKTGTFSMYCQQKNNLLKIAHPRYIDRIFAISLDSSIVDLGILVLYQSNAMFEPDDAQGIVQSANLITQYQAKYTSGLSFRFRGSARESWSLEGISMNNLLDGRPYRQEVLGIYPLLSTSTRPFVNQLLTQVPLNFDNAPQEKSIVIKGGAGHQQNYNHIGLTLRGGSTSTGWSSIFHVSRRWTEEGYFKGSLYDSWALGFSVNRHINTKNTFSATALYVPIRQGRRARLTDRVYQKMGAKYNPLWGMQLSLQRNSTISKSRMPLFYMSYTFHPNPWKLKASMMLRVGKRTNSRLGYQNANNPFPDYWAKQESIQTNPQIDWYTLYQINQNQTNALNPGSANYMVYNEVVKEKTFAAKLEFQTNLSERMTWDLALVSKITNDVNYAQPIDLLGAHYYNDVNEFILIDGMPAEYDVGKPQKHLGDKIKFNFKRHAQQHTIKSQLNYKSKTITTHFSASVSQHSFYRTGNFTNQRYPDNSYGKSNIAKFNPFTLSATIIAILGLKQQLHLTGIWSKKAPTFTNSYVNPREHNTLIPRLGLEKEVGFAGSHLFKSTALESQLTGYWSRVSNSIKVQSFFAEVGIGAHFFNSMTTGLDHQKIGVEWSLRYRWNPNFHSHIVLALGQFSYTANANVSVNYNPTALDNNTLEPLAFKDLGKTYLKNYHLGNGPEQRYGIALAYEKNRFDIKVAANFYNSHYLQISSLRRTSSFFTNPQTNGQPFDDIDIQEAKALLKQKRIPSIALINAKISKWWRGNKLDLGLSLRLQNLLNANYKTNGYEQTRLASYAALRDDVGLGTKRNFGPKYNFGLGRTISLQCTVKF